jgi:hypothetical protein
MRTPTPRQRHVFDLDDRCEPLQRAVASRDREMVHDLIEGLSAMDISWLLVEAFHRPGPGRPLGRDPTERAYYKRLLRFHYHRLKQQWCNTNGRRRVTDQAENLANRAIAECEARYPPFRSLGFAATDLLRPNRR